MSESKYPKRFIFQTQDPARWVSVPGWTEDGARASYRRNLCEEKKHCADLPLIRVEDVVIIKWHNTEPGPRSF